MHIDEIRRLVRRQPFQSFRILVSDGSHYDVPHHDLMIVSPKVIEIGIAKEAQAYPSRIVSCEPPQITRILPLDGHEHTNGRKRKS